MTFSWWRPEKNPGPAREYSYYGGLLLMAAEDGEWYVAVDGDRRHKPMLVGSTMQAPGQNIDEAKQRAQAAAIVQHQLRNP